MGDLLKKPICINKFSIEPRDEYGHPKQILTVNTSSVCGGGERPCKEIPIGKISVTYKVNYKFFNRSTPLPLGYFPLNVGGRYGQYTEMQSKYGVSIEVLSVSSISSSVSNGYKQNLSKAWNHITARDSIPNSAWDGDFGKIGADVTKAYNDSGVKDDIKIALELNQTPLVYTPEFANFHNQINVMASSRKIGRNSSMVLTSELYVSGTPGLATITKDLGKTTNLADKFASAYSEAYLIPDGGITIPQIKGLFCDTYAIADTLGGQVRIHAEKSIAATKVSSLNLEEMNRSRNLALKALYDTTPANWSLVSQQNESNLVRAIRNGSVQLGRTLTGDKGFSPLAIGGTGFQVGAVGQTSGGTYFRTGVECGIINSFSCRFDLEVGVLVILGTGEDGKPWASSFDIMAKSKHITLENAAVLGFKAARYLVEYIGRQVNDRSKPTAQKLAETKAAVAEAVTKGDITPEQGAAIDRTADSAAAGFKDTAGQTLGQVMTGTNTNSGVGAPSTNNNFQYKDGPDIVGDGIIGRAAVLTNQVQTTSNVLNPGASITNPPTATSTNVTNATIVPPSLSPSTTPTPSPDTINASNSEVTNVVVGSSSGTIATTNTITAYKPDGTTTNVTTLPGLNLHQGNTTNSVPVNHQDDPSNGAVTPLEVLGSSNTVLYFVGEEGKVTPTFGNTSQTTNPAFTANLNLVPITQSDNGATAPGGAGSLITFPIPLPNYFGPGFNGDPLQPDGTTSVEWNKFREVNSPGNIFIEDDPY